MKQQGEPVLEVSGLTKRFQGNAVVNRIDFSIHPGEVLTLLGESGCGKSTTLRLIAGLERPEEGEIMLRGRLVASAREKIFSPPERRNLGLVFQSYAIWPHMTVGENVGYPLRIRKLSAGEAAARIRQICGLVGLGDLIDRPATQLSGGQQQRVALARALVYEPDVLLLDEPLSNLDAKLREELKSQIKALQGRLRTSILYVTHDQSEAMALSHRVAVMRKGIIEQLDTPSAIYDRPASYFVHNFVGRTVEFDVVVASTSGASSTVSFGDRSSVTLHVNQAAPSGQKARMVVRPEDIQFVGAAPGGERQNVVTAKVEQLNYGGDHYDGTLSIEGHEFSLRLPKEAAANSSGELTLRLPPEKIRLWPDVGVP